MTEGLPSILVPSTNKPNNEMQGSIGPEILVFGFICSEDSGCHSKAGEGRDVETAKKKDDIINLLGCPL